MRTAELAAPFPAKSVGDVDLGFTYTSTLCSLGFPRQQLPQHILQNPAVGVVQRLLRRVDAQHPSNTIL
jgi:hypothetical protein